VGVREPQAQQAKASRAAGLPHVVVLGQGHSDTAFDPLMVAGGMFGNVGVTFSVQADAGDPVPPDDVRSTFLGGGRLQSKLNRSVSALALLTSFNPTLWRAETACESRLARVRARSANRSSPRDRAEAVRLIMETYEHLVATGAFDPNACVARITVLHNPHAAIPLDLSAAAGPHDEQWGAVVGDNVVVYTRVTSGIRAWEIPGRRDHAA